MARETPDRGSSAASQALELPRGRVRSWFDGATPLLHAIDTAEVHGWLDAGREDRTFEGLVVLHAWVLAGGCISANDAAIGTGALIAVFHSVVDVDGNVTGATRTVFLRHDAGRPRLTGFSVR